MRIPTYMGNGKGWAEQGAATLSQAAWTLLRVSSQEPTALRLIECTHRHVQKSEECLRRSHALLEYCARVLGCEKVQTSEDSKRPAPTEPQRRSGTLHLDRQNVGVEYPASLAAAADD